MHIEIYMDVSSVNLPPHPYELELGTSKHVLHLYKLLTSTRQLTTIIDLGLIIILLKSHC